MTKGGMLRLISKFAICYRDWRLTGTINGRCRSASNPSRSLRRGISLDQSFNDREFLLQSFVFGNELRVFEPFPGGVLNWNCLLRSLQSQFDLASQHLLIES